MVNIATKIGKDVIESLTLGMYEDSRFIYREYIQNAADQIDKAVELGQLESLNEGRVEIEIDRENRRIVIYDNATGIPAAEVAPILKNIAQSTKDRSRNKGFRGIGRLGGLAYSDRLIFETSYKGEDTKSVLVWDAQKLKAIINNRAQKEEAAAVIDDVTLLITEKEDAETSYFKVTLEGISNDILLDKEGILDYLAMVAPVPYSKSFLYKSQVYDTSKNLNQSIDEYNVYINNNQVEKAYTTSIYEGEKNNAKKIDDIHDIEFFDIFNHKKQLVAWGWYSISNFTKQIPKVNLARGLRLRKGNIQIGLEDCLVKLFKESRGSYYFFGEVHAVHPDLIPNARRDYFLENDTLEYFEHHLKVKFEELHKLYHFSSKVRSKARQIDKLVNFQEEFKEKSKKGFTNEKEKNKYKEKFQVLKQSAKKAEAELGRVSEKFQETSEPQKKIFENIVGYGTKPVEKIADTQLVNEPITKLMTDDLKISKKDKKLISRIFAVIDNVLPKPIADNLKDKIKEEFE